MWYYSPRHFNSGKTVWLINKDKGAAVLAIKDMNQAEYIVHKFNHDEEVIRRQRNYITMLEVLWDSLSVILEDDRNRINDLQKKFAIESCEHAELIRDLVSQQKEPY